MPASQPRQPPPSPHPFPGSPPPLLTGLAPDPRQPGYQLVEVDRGRFASLPVEAVEPLGLVVGRAIPAASVARLRELADIEAAQRAALRALSRRPLARFDLRRRLVRKQHPPAAVDRVLEQLAARGLVDDRRFAEQYAAVRGGRGRGPSRLVKDLLSQGVDRAIAEQAVRRALADEGIDPRVEARAVAARRLRQLADLPPPVRRRRLLAYLARRGFSGPAVTELVDRMCRGRGFGNS